MHSKFFKHAETEIKKIQLGGYSMIQQERDHKLQNGECTLFMFLAKTSINANVYKQVQPLTQLNIYKAYFENCSYAYILEYFIQHTDITELKENLQHFNTNKPLVYTEI